MGAHRLIACQGSGIETVCNEVKRLGTEVTFIPGSTSAQLLVDQLREASVDAPIRGIVLGDSEIYVRAPFHLYVCL